MELQVTTKQSGQTVTITLSGPATNSTGHVLEKEIGKIAPEPKTKLLLDMTALEEMDTAGAIIVAQFIERIKKSECTVEMSGLKPRFQGLLQLINPEIVFSDRLIDQSKQTGLLEKFGTYSVVFYNDTKAFFTFIGEFSIELLRSIIHPKRIRLTETLFYMERAGADAIPIVFLLALLLGLILAFQAALQLRQFGANIYVADLVGVSITRELGPLIAAIIVAGRSGSAFAAEIGTMKVSEEIAALEVMGLDRMRFLVIPKVIALVIMMPCLALLSDVVGIAGGMIVGIFQLDLSVTSYLQETRQALLLGDIVTGMIKSVVFALLIAGIGCFRGLQVSNDAESVGRLTTSAVVSGIFLIILADATFTVTFYIMGV